MIRKKRRKAVTPLVVMTDCYATAIVVVCWLLIVPATC